MLLITGASRGVGRALARLFAEDGAGLVLTARIVERLCDVAATYGVKEHVVPAELSRPRRDGVMFRSARASIRKASLTVVS